MTDKIKLKKDYTLANCCRPCLSDDIIGYYSYGNVIKVHKKDCPNLNKAEQERLVQLEWKDITEDVPSFEPDDNYNQLDENDWRVLEHHREYGVDYSLVVARKLVISQKSAFDCHKKLREMGLLERVQPLIIQYRKGIVDNKWIKHRNHTYYDLTNKGKSYLDYYLENR